MYAVNSELRQVLECSHHSLSVCVMALGEAQMHLQ